MSYYSFLVTRYFFVLVSTIVFSYVFTLGLFCLYFHEFLVLSPVQFSCSVVSNSLRPHESQHARPPCSSPTPRVHSDSCPFSQWCHPAISSSVVPFSSCPQSLPASESFPMSQLFAWGGQSTRVSDLASVLPKKSQAWSPLEWTGWISLQSKRLSRVFSNTTIQKHVKYAAAAAKSLQSCLTVRPHGLQPTRLLRPWDFPGKSTGMGRHCLLWC